MAVNTSQPSIMNDSLSELSTTGLLAWEHRVSVIVVYDIICILGIFTNGIPIYLTFFTNLNRVNVNLMIANMSSADMINCFVILTQNMYILYRDELPEIGCTVLGFFQFMMDVQVFVFPPFLSLNRYVSVFYNHLYENMFSRKRIFLFILITWIVCGLIPFMFTIGGQSKYDEANEHCCVVTNGHLAWSIVYWIVILIPLIGLCDGTILYCNYKIFKRLCDHAAVKSLNINIVKQHKEMLVYLLVEMLLPVTAHTVYHIVKFAYFERDIVFFRIFFAGVVFFNSALRGVMTLTLLGPYRRECEKILSMIPSASSVFTTPAASNSTAKTPTTSDCGDKESKAALMLCIEEKDGRLADKASGVYIGDASLVHPVYGYGSFEKMMKDMDKETTL